MTHPAVELYHLVTGENLSDDQADALEQMLTRTADCKWASREVAANDRMVLEARALYGLFVLDEDIVWSFYRAGTRLETFQRMADLVQSDILRDRVKSVRRANGEQQIQLTSGRRIQFGCRAHGRGLRGISSDCHLFDEALGGSLNTRQEARATALLLGAGRRNPQLITCW